MLPFTLNWNVRHCMIWVELINLCECIILTNHLQRMENAEICSTHAYYYTRWCIQLQWINIIYDGIQFKTTTSDVLLLFFVVVLLYRKKNKYEDNLGIFLIIFATVRSNVNKICLLLLLLSSQYFYMMICVAFTNYSIPDHGEKMF